MEKICDYQGISFVATCEIHTAQIKSSTYHQAYSANDILKVNVANTNEGTHKYKFDLSNYNIESNKTASLFSSNISHLISDKDLKDVDILRLDLKFDFIGISYEQLYPVIRVLIFLLAVKNKADNNFIYKMLLDPDKKSIGFSQSNGLGVQFYKKKGLQKKNTDVDARFEFQFSGLHFKDDKTEIMTLWEKLVDTLSEAVTKENFEAAEQQLNERLIAHLKSNDPFARIENTCKSKKGYIHENKIYVISRKQLIDLLGRFHIDHPEETADNMLRKKKADPEFCGYVFTETDGKIKYRDLLLFTLRDVKRLSRSILKLAAGFFFETCPSENEAKAIKKSLNLFKVRGDGENDDFFKVRDPR